MEPGDYMKLADGNWLVRPPGCSNSGSLTNHSVVEHEDGTITVSPSILHHDDKSEWHGFLEKGVWRTA